MTKLRNRRQDAPTIDDSVAELATIAKQDRSVARERVAGGDTKAEAEEAALPAQREAYERAMGRKPGRGRRVPPIEAEPPPRRRRALQVDERRGAEDDEEEEEEEGQRTTRGQRELDADDEETDLDDDAEDEGEEGEADAAPSRRAKDDLKKVQNALRRVDAPDWVFELDEKRQREIARSLAGYQSNVDRAITSKDETIRALTAALAGKGTRVQADDESHGRATPPEDDLEEAATEVARAMGVESDEGARKALVKFGQKLRGNNGKVSSSELDSLRANLRDVLINQGIKDARRVYSELRSDKEAVDRLRKRALMQVRTGEYENDQDASRLIRDSALIEFGPPEKRRPAGRALSRKGSAPVTHERVRREPRELQQGTEEHDRAVFTSVTRRGREGFAVRR
jgi:hypothetical protein